MGNLVVDSHFTNIPLQKKPLIIAENQYMMKLILLKV